MSIETLRARLQEAQSRNNDKDRPKTSSTGDNASFPFWDMPVGTSTVARFLPDGDVNNDLFWVERQVVKMPFDGVVGGDYPTNKKVEVTVPCLNMFGMECPIQAETKPLWKGSPAEVSIARTYWKKRSFIFQGFKVNSSLDEENEPENPIRKWVINKSIYDIIYNSLMDPEFTMLPTDYDQGRDFKINKTTQGEYANYGTSNWSMAGPRSLSEFERNAIEKFGLFDLKQSLGAKPDADGIEAIKAMFKDSFDGNPFDMESYGKYYRPYTNKSDSSNSNVSSPIKELKEEAAPETPKVVQENTADTSKQRADDIIARLRAKSNG